MMRFGFASILPFVGMAGCAASSTPSDAADAGSSARVTDTRRSAPTNGARSPPAGDAAPAAVSSLSARVFGADALRSCESDLEYLNQVTGWQVQWPRQWQAFAGTKQLSDEAAARWASVPAVLARLTTDLSARAGKPGAAPAPVVRRVLQQVDELAEALRRRDPAYYEAPARWQAHLDAIQPAVIRFRNVLRETYLPRAPQRPGLHAVPHGRACFAEAVHWWTSLSPSADEIVATGERLLRAERRALEATSSEPFESILQRLRRSDPNERSDTLIDRSRAALRRAKSGAKKAFGFVPPSPQVVPMEAHLQASFPAGYYRSGAEPAYVVNPSRPGSRRLMAEVIAFHEGLPGHHLFAAYRRDGHRGVFNAGLLEGWAIYAEYLADELGLYSSTYDRQGMIAKHLWASSRLIVEPGLHLHGWSRAEAIDYMQRITALAREEIALEVDRYIAMPGQSLSYMLGYDAIAQARAKAERVLRDRFDLRAFHHVVVEPGRRTLGEMREDVDRWIRTMAGNGLAKRRRADRRR